MSLFRSKGKSNTNIDKLRHSFARVYLDSNQQLIDAFRQMGLTDDEIADNTNIQNGLLTLHITIVAVSQSPIKDEAKIKTASQLLLYFEDMMVKDFSISLSKLHEDVSKAYKAYMGTLRNVINNSTEADAPILSAVKTIQSLSDFYVERGQLNMMMQLPSVEQKMLENYKQYWVKNL